MTESHNKYDTDKMKSIDVFRKLFEPWLMEPITILEIGVWRGESLRLWTDWFPHANIVGIDCDLSKCQFTHERVTLYEGRQENLTFLSDVILNISAPTVIIDDAGHFGRHIKRSFNFLLPHLLAGGVYIIEDWQVGCWPESNDGLYRPGTLAFVRRLVDRMGSASEDEYNSVPCVEFAELVFCHRLCYVRKPTLSG